MKRKISKIISALTTISLCLQMFPMYAYAESVGSSERETQKVEIQENNEYVSLYDTNVLQIETNVILKSGSLGVADSAKITGLTQGKRYKITYNDITKYVKADGTLSDNEADAGKILGTEILGLTNGETYDVQRYFAKPKNSNHGYFISSPDDLMWISQNNAAYDGFKDYYFIQTQDIDMSGENFEPIGAEIPFEGSYDGDLKKIVNLTIDKTVDAEERVCIGLFGIVDSGILTNIILENPDIKLTADYSNVGGIAGIFRGYELNDCHVVSTNGKKSSLYAKGSTCIVGGIVGRMDSSLQRCSVDANITAEARDIVSHYVRVGGIVGENSGNICNCFHEGEIKVLENFEDKYIGGIAGISFSRVECSIAVSDFPDNKETDEDTLLGGLIGYSNHIPKCEGSFYLNTIAKYGVGNDTYSSNLSRTEQELKTGENFYKWSKNTWVIEDGCYPVLRTISTSSTMVGLLPKSLGDAGNQKITNLMQGVKYKVFGDCYTMYTKADGTLTLIEEDIAPISGTEITGLSNNRNYCVLKYYPAPNGRGTIDNPYEISKPEDLIWLSQGIGGIYGGSYFKQTHDIDMNGIEFEPIGSFDKVFHGTYDGGNYKISNLTIKSNRKDIGLFGIISNSTLQNIILENVSIKKNSEESFIYVGGIVATSFSSNIRNCHIISSYGKESVIENSGKVSATGGIVGLLKDFSTVSECSVNANIEVSIGNETGTDAEGYIGGIVGLVSNGTNDSICDCINMAIIELRGTALEKLKMGGIAGQVEGNLLDDYQVRNCYSIGQMFNYAKVTKAFIGGIMGSNTNVSSNNCFYLNTCASKGVGEGNEAGVFSKTDAELKTVSTFDAWDNAIWIKAEGKYPILKTLAKILDADNAIKTAFDALDETDFKYAHGDSVYSVKNDVILPLTGENGTTINWAEKTDSSNNILITGDKLKVTRPTHAQGDKNVVLVATISKTGGKSLTKEITIRIIALAEETGGGSSGGSGGSVGGGSVATTDEPKSSSGIVKTQIKGKLSDKKIAEASVSSTDFTKALKTAKKGTVAEISFEIPKDSKGMKATMPLETIKALKEIEKPELKLKSSLAEISFDAAAAETIVKATSKSELSIEVKQVEKDTMTDDIKKIIGDEPVYEFSVTADKNKIAEFNGTVTVSIPYTLKDGETSDHISVYYLSENDGVQRMENVKYDAKNKCIVFTTTHFSKFAVAYDKYVFNDVSGWAQDYIYYLANQDIVKGVTNSQFAPNSSITRAEFATILARMSGENLESYRDTMFSDVKASDWYCTGASWANAKGIANGYNDKFNPMQKITRQDMAVMLARFAEKQSKNTLTNKNNTAFADEALIADYARDAVVLMQKSGIISGKDGNRFAPKDNATRAEASKMLAVFLQSTQN